MPARLQAGALRARQRKGGNRIGFLTWHFTVQGNLAIQHLPTTEQGEHADFDGPGNNYSIGIEMCEHRGNNLAATIGAHRQAGRLPDDTAITFPFGTSSPTTTGRAKGQNPPNKNCPHFLMENGRPGRKWAGVPQPRTGPLQHRWCRDPCRDSDPPGFNSGLNHVLTAHHFLLSNSPDF